jgi:hypothetical protein
MSVVLDRLEVLDRVKEEIERTIQSLESTTFKVDPIAGQTFSKITSVISSSYKRHGNILERAILEALRENPNFEVWREEAFQVPQTVDHMVSGSLDQASKLIGVDYPYSVTGDRTLQVDAIVYNKQTKVLRAYEVKRGNGLHDAGKTRSMLRDTLCVQVLLKSYGKERGLDVQEAFSHIIFYYGECSLRKPFALTGAELDDHFGFPIHAAVEEVNQHFRKRLFDILSGG